jgi:hypothetical protein
MIQERNNKITLDEQIAQTKINIVDGKETYPIDIVDTIENDLQLYYGLPNYWERYRYDGNGDIIGYMDSGMVQELTPSLITLHDIGQRRLTEKFLSVKMVRINPALWTKYDSHAMLYEIAKQIAIKSNRAIITATQEQPKKELKVYMIELDDIDSFDNTPYRDCHNNFFIKEAERQENVYSIMAYENAINHGQISRTSKLIRFIEA